MKTILSGSHELHAFSYSSTCSQTANMETSSRTYRSLTGSGLPSTMKNNLQNKKFSECETQEEKQEFMENLQQEIEEKVTS